MWRAWFSSKPRRPASCAPGGPSPCGLPPPGRKPRRLTRLRPHPAGSLRRCAVSRSRRGGGGEQQRHPSAQRGPALSVALGRGAGKPRVRPRPLAAAALAELRAQRSGSRYPRARLRDGGHVPAARNLPPPRRRRARAGFRPAAARGAAVRGGGGVVFLALRLYRGIWRHATATDLVAVTPGRSWHSSSTCRRRSSSVGSRPCRARCRSSSSSCWSPCWAGRGWARGSGRGRGGRTQGGAGPRRRER